MNILQIFPTIVSYTKNFLNETEINLLLKMIEDAKTENHQLLGGDAESSYDNYDILKDLKLKRPYLYDKIENQLNNHVYAIGLPEQAITNSWFNVQQENSELFVHNHPDSKISSALYLRADDDSSKLYFHDVHPHKQMEHYVKSTELNEVKYWVKPERGLMVCFPSWLKHSSDNEKNLTNNRTVISFNSLNKGCMDGQPRIKE